MKFVYENERGKVVMHGGGMSGFNIIKITGLSIPENNVNTVRYPNAAGQTVTQSTPMERIITISADVRDDNKRQISNAGRVFSLPGTIYITAFGKTKKIAARCVSFEPGVKKGSYVPFTLQFCADNPYFEDIYETTTNITKREGCLSSPFVLECAFSKRLFRNNVINHGDVPIEPVFYISSDNGTVCPNGITVKNLTNGNSVLLNTDLQAGEEIILDVQNRKITSNIRGNIISCLAQDVSLSRFSLDVGVSEVEILANGSDGKIATLCKHNNKYASVMV